MIIFFPKFNAVHSCWGGTRAPGGISALFLAGSKATPRTAKAALSLLKTVTHKASSFPETHLPSPEPASPPLTKASPSALGLGGPLKPQLQAKLTYWSTRQGTACTGAS